jgi:O-antigen/teichoic acid export membrane protein
MFDNVRRVSRQLFAYGTADVMVLVVNFLLLPLYTRVLSPREYGALALLLLCEAFLKVVNRWGLDHGLLRLYYDQPTDGDRRTLASSVALFIAVANAAIAAVLLALTGPINQRLFGSQEFASAYQWLVVNNFISGFLFLPLTRLRVEERARLYASLTFLRSFGTVLVRLVLVIGFRMGVLGLVLADVVVTIVLTVALLSTTRRMLTRRFSTSKLRELLAYGLPHVPHGLLSQTMSMVDRFVLGLYMPLEQVGIYLIGSTVSSVVKFYPVAFEAAWMPFAFDSLRRNDAPALFARMATYAFAVLALSTVALAALAPPTIDLLLPASYRAAVPLVPLLAAGMAVQSLAWFPMTSVNVAKRTSLYPVVTAIGAAVSIGANLALIPTFGMHGAAYALIVSQAITTAVTVIFAQRAYFIPYEGGRLVKVAAAAVLTYAAAALVQLSSPAWTIVARAALLVLFPLGLLAARFLQPHEWSEIKRLVAQFTTPAEPAPSPTPTGSGRA